MEKTPRYTSNEKRLLLKLIYNQRDIIEKKKTDSFTNRAKENAWSIITKSYNQCVKFKRTTKQLRQLYKNMKYAANVNSTSTTNLSEMLEILNMQILSDPNVRIGENFSMKQNNPTDLSQSSSSSQQQQQQQQHHQQQPYMPKQHNFFINNIIKTELMDADDVDDLDNDILAVAQQNNEKLSHLQQQLESNLDLSQFASSVAPSSGGGGGGGGGGGTGGGSITGGTIPNLPQNLLFPNVLANQQLPVDLDDIDDDDDDDDGEDDDEIDSKTNINDLKKIASKLFQNPFTMKNNNNSNNLNNDNNCAINMTSNNNNNNTSNNNNCSSNTNNQNAMANNNKKETKDALISIAIEERRKKIELLETQINYWKTLTTKIENCDKICCCKIDSFHNRNSNNNTNSSNPNINNTSSNNIVATPIINNIEN